MEIKLQIKNRYTGSLLFEFEKEDNTIKQTLLEAVNRGAYLQGADLKNADLRGVDLHCVDLRGVDLQGADLKNADLRDAYLQGADLRCADLRGAYLQGAYLQGAYLRCADLRGAYLQGAYLQGAYLQGADLQGANLQGAEKIKTAAVLTGLYTYVVIPYITEEGEKRIQLGCYNRLLAEWEADFWNNDNEFPNNNSLKSNLRLMAFNTAKEWLKLNENV